LTNFERWVLLMGQKKVADELGVSKQLVNQWVSNGKRPSDTKKIEIIKIAKPLLDFNSFFEEEEDETTAE